MDVNLETVLLAIISAIMSGMIPWAYNIGQKVTAISTRLNNGLTEALKDLTRRGREHSDSIHTLEGRVARLESDSSVRDLIRQLVRQSIETNPQK